MFIVSNCHFCDYPACKNYKGLDMCNHHSNNAKKCYSYISKHIEVQFNSMWSGDIYTDHYINKAIELFPEYVKTLFNIN